MQACDREDVDLDVPLSNLGLPRTRVMQTIGLKQPFLSALSLMANEVRILVL